MMFSVDGSAFSGRNRPLPPERGATLLETALSVALMGSLLVFVNAVVTEEAERQRNQSLGRDLRLMTQFAQRYMRAEYRNLQGELAKLSGADAIMEIPLQTLADTGHLPSSFLQSGRHLNSENQSFAILVRGVSRLDTANPQTTLTVAGLDANGDDAVDPVLVDGNPVNDELDLEALLVTAGGEPLPAQHGNPAAAAAGMAVVGYVQAEGTASGPFGSWSLNISPFQALSAYPAAGRFVSLLALSGFGVLDFQNADGTAGGGYDGNPFERCPGSSGAALTDCAGNNDIYTDMRFRPADTDGDGDADEFAGISGVHSIGMAAPADADADGTADLFPEITGLLRVACGMSGSATASAGTILMECADVKFTGNAAIDGSLTLSGDAEIAGELNLGKDLTAAGDAAANRFIAAAIGDQDLTKGVYQGQIVAMNGSREVDKPVCRDAGSQATVLAAPAAFASPDGSPVVGLKAIAETVAGENKWIVRMQAALDRDSDGDGKADVIDLRSADDYVLALTKCS